MARFLFAPEQCADPFAAVFRSSLERTVSSFPFLRVSRKKKKPKMLFIEFWEKENERHPRYCWVTVGSSSEQTSKEAKLRFVYKRHNR